MKPFLLISLLLILPWRVVAKGELEPCDPAPMVLPNNLKTRLVLSIGEAQQLSTKAKAKLGLQLLLKSQQSSPFIQAYLDYYLAQMYSGVKGLEEYRVFLLSSALQGERLYGAELQDALYSLSQLYLQMGEQASYEAYLLQWQSKSCEPQFAEARLERPVVSAGSNGANMPDDEVIEPAKGQSDINLAPKLLQYIEPLYPNDAYQNDISGYVSLSFTITRDGFVTNIRVVEAKPRQVFDRVALEAVRQWLFRPMVVKGEPTAKDDHRVRLQFDIQTRE